MDLRQHATSHPPGGRERSFKKKTSWKDGDDMISWEDGHAMISWEDGHAMISWEDGDAMI